MNIAQLAASITCQMAAGSGENSPQYSTFQVFLAESVYHLFLSPVMATSPGDATALTFQENRLIRSALTALELQGKNPTKFTLTAPTMGPSSTQPLFLMATLTEKGEEIALRVLLEDEEPEKTEFRPIRLRLLTRPLIAA